MDGNVDPEGVVRDLTWLHEIGVRGVQLFDGGMGVPLVVPEPVRPGSATWDDAVRAAVATAAELGMELAVATSAGWSAAGGPWVEPADAMKKVVWSETVVDGGPVDIALPPLPDIPGTYQDAPRWGSRDAARWAAAWRVVALPAHPAHDVLRPAAVTASSEISDPSCLTDGAFGPAIALPRDPEAWSCAWIEQEFAEPVEVRSVVVGLPGPSGFGAAPAPHAVLEVSDDGVRYRKVMTLPASSVPTRSASFSPVRARRFRLVLSGASAADALPAIADGIRRPPVLRPAHSFTVSEFALRAGGRIHHGETKSAFGVEPDYYAVETDPGADAAAVAPADVVDISHLVADGRLTWTAPPGRWRILRLGASLTGQTNGPAPADATGLEVDKLHGGRVSAYLDRYLQRFGDASAPGGISALLSDSIESGPQNWTDDIAERFRAARGYDPTPWLPALTGMLIDSAEASDRFLYDYRRTISELLASEYYGTLAEAAHRRGMVHYAEALEDGRPQLGDDLAMRSHADVPMGAMWTFDPGAGPRPTYVADLKGAASVAHVHGRKWTGAEAFTSFDRPWASTPGSLKHVADLQLALGVTRFCIHTSPHQPMSAPPPGIALAPFLGQAFTRNETWAALAGPWIDYLARCSAVLSAGEPAVEIAVFVGEEAPVTGLYDDAPDATVPDGFDFDYIGADALADVLRVEEEHIVSKGARYLLLYLGGSSRRMTNRALRSLENLLDEGATIVGLRPESSPSLGDDPSEFDHLCDRVWSTARTRGRVIATSDLAAAIAELGLRPALAIDGPPLRRIARIVDGRRVTFLANPTAVAVTARLVPAAGTADLVSWDPVTVRATALPAGTSSGRRSFALTLPPFGSSFVLSGEAPMAAAASARLAVAGPWVLELPDRPAIEFGERPLLWTEVDDAARGFSGSGVYRVGFDLPAEMEPGRDVSLDLGTVAGIARVVVNGVDCGVAWTPPFGVDITAAVSRGRNTLEVEVATPWRNRLIAEAQAPSGELFAPMTTVFEPIAAFLPAGLAGPVAVVVH